MVVLGVVVLVRVVYQDELLQTMEQQVSCYQRGHCTCSVGFVRLRQVEDLRQDVECDHTQQHPGGKAQDVVQAVAELEREQPADHRRAEGRQREQDNGHGRRQSSAVIRKDGR